MYAKEDLKRQRKCMNIQKNDTVLIHTSMKAVGKTENGTRSVTDVFRDVPEELYR